MKAPIPERLARSWANLVEEEGAFGVTRAAFVDRCLATIDDRAGDDVDRRELVYERLIQPDLFLALGCLEGDRHAMRRFMVRFGSYLRTIAQKHVRSTTMADEVEAEMLATLFTARKGSDKSTARLHSYRGVGPLQGWLRVTTHRVAIDQQRRTKYHESASVLDRHDSGQPGAESRLAKLDAAHKLRPIFSECIEALSDDDRTLLRLYYRDNQVLREIAETMGIKTTSVFRRLEKARSAVWKAFKLRARNELKLGERDLKGLLSAIAENLRLDDLFALAIFLVGLAELPAFVN